MAQGHEGATPSAQDIGELASTLGVVSKDMVAVHAAALLASVPQSGAKEFTFAAEFLAQSLEALESELARHNHQTLKRAAHELRTPLTTLSLALQVGLSRLRKGRRGRANYIAEGLGSGG